MRIKLGNYYWVRVLLLAVGVSLLGVLIWSGREVGVNRKTTEQTASQARQPLVNSEQEALRTAAMSISRGYFETARKNLATLGTKLSQDNVALQLREMLAKNDQIAKESEQARQEAYQEYLQNINEQAKTAQWREQMLQASEAFDFENEQKKAEENKLRQQIQNQWLRALAFLTNSHVLAQRTGLEETIDEQLQQVIVKRSLEAAEQYERENKWNEAFARVYYNLTFLDEINQQYELESRRLLRQALLVSIYAPDPNLDTLPWPEKRKGITFDIFSAGLQQIDGQYVETPDYRQMSRQALQYCLYLVQTEKLAQTFTQLNDAQAVWKYRTELEQFSDKVETRPAGYFSNSQLLVLLRDVQRVNQETIKLPEEVIVAEFAEGAFSALDDYTNLIWPADVATMRKDVTNEFSGIGVLISMATGRLRVETLLENSPAARAGLDAGDIIVAIDGKKTANMNIDLAVRLITGKAGTDVVLTVERGDFTKLREITITRDLIVVKTVKGLNRDRQGQWQYYLDEDKGIAYLRLTSFAEETTERLRQTLEQLRRKNLQGLVLDVRGNSGGFLSTAIEVTDIFLSSGDILSTRIRGGRPAVFDRAKSETTFDDKLPMVVLANEQSASASEILAGALKDRGRALIVGTRTFGKGKVQTIQPLRPYEAELRTTIAYFYLPSGRRINRDPKDKSNKDYGVEPDVNLALTAAQMQLLNQVQREAETLHQIDTEKTTEQQKWKSYTAEEILASDPQLTMAYLCLQGKIIAETLNKNRDLKLAQRNKLQSEK